MLGTMINMHVFSKSLFLYFYLNSAAYAIIDNKEYHVDPQCILVPDSLKTLQELARFHREKFSIPVIGIAGSNQPTTIV